MIILQILATSLIQSLFERLGEYLFELRSERVKTEEPENDTKTGGTSIANTVQYSVSHRGVPC